MIAHFTVSEVPQFFHPKAEKLYFPNACHVCRVYGENVELKRCSNCKKLAYCSREHQKKHWPEHKRYCREISKVVDAFEMYYKMHPLSKDPNEAWKWSKKFIMLNLEQAFKRSIMQEEMEIIAFTRSCKICRETDPLKLKDCTDCPGASFCIEHPRDSRHSAQCERTRLCFEYHNSARNHNNLLPMLILREDFPKDMDETINNYSLLCPMDKVFTSPQIWKIFLSEQFSRPYTFLYAMEKLPPPKKDKITIHVIGSNSREMTNIQLWQFILCYRQALQQVKIVFIGPQLFNNSAEYRLGNPVTMCCRKVNVYIVENLYADFAAGKSFTKPDYVVGFNLGLASIPLKMDAWAPSIKILGTLDCPFFITDYNAFQLTSDQKRINSYLGKQIEPFWSGKNPFFSSRSLREFVGDEEEITLGNQYLTIYEKLS